MKTFVTVATEGHLTRAAERLHSSQPTVSAHIKALEEELGILLFTRVPKGMQLTNAGHLLKEKAMKMLDIANDIQNQARQLKSELTGVVSVGLNIDPKYLRISELYKLVKGSYPGLELHMLQKTSWDVMEAIRTGHLDTGFIYGRVDSEIEAVTLTSFNLVIAGPLDWAEKLKNPDLKSLGELPWILCPERCYFSHTFTTLFEQQNITPIKAAVTDQESTMKALAVSGAGLTLMIEEEALDAVAGNMIAMRKKPVDTIELSIAYGKKQANNPMIQAIVESAREIWSN